MINKHTQLSKEPGPVQWQLRTITQIRTAARRCPWWSTRTGIGSVPRVALTCADRRNPLCPVGFSYSLLSPNLTTSRHAEERLRNSHTQNRPAPGAVGAAPGPASPTGFAYSSAGPYQLLWRYAGHVRSGGRWWRARMA